MKDDKVNNTHPQYDATAPARKVYQDVSDGTAKMRTAGTAYLPKFPQETDESYSFRRDTATLLNVTEKTVETLCGLVFQKEVTLDDEVPQPLKDLAENIDNKGTQLSVFARDLFEDAFDGWAVILVDAPATIADDAGQQKALGLRPYWVPYCADEVINWDYQINPVSKKRELSMIVLKETRTRKKGQFIREEYTQYRVYMLEGSTVTWQLWEQQGEGDTAKFNQIEGGIIDKQTSIPVAMIGELGDPPPLDDLVRKNIEHYQTYSDYKSAIHKTNRPLFFSVNLEGEPTAIGSDVWFKCGLGGSIGYVEPAGASFASTRLCLEDVKVEMAWLGAQMLMPKPKQGASSATATEVISDNIQDTSALQVRATQCQGALEQALGYTNVYLGGKFEDAGSVSLGCSWQQMILSPTDLTAWNSMVSDGTVSLETFLYKLEKAGQLPPDITAADEMKRIDEEMKKNAAIKPVVDANNQPNETTDTQQAPAPQKKAAPAVSN
jgi:hypothetical protein